MRDWLHVEDHCRAIELILQRGRAGHDRRYAIDASKIGRELGFEPERDFDAGLAATMDWYVANEPWWSALLLKD